MSRRDPLRVATKLHQRIVAASRSGPQAVFVSVRGEVDCCTVDGERYKALESMPGFVRRLAGVFDAGCTVAGLAAALREVLA